jgi:hypothetical protein
MTKRLALLALGGLLMVGPAFAQGSTGSISRPGWSRGSAPTSDFNSQGTPMTRSQALRQRAAAARGQAGPVGTPARRTRR